MRGVGKAHSLSCLHILALPCFALAATPAACNRPLWRAADAGFSQRLPASACRLSHPPPPLRHWLGSLLGRVPLGLGARRAAPRGLAKLSRRCVDCQRRGWRPGLNVARRGKPAHWSARPLQFRSRQMCPCLRVARSAVLARLQSARGSRRLHCSGCCCDFGRRPLTYGKAVGLIFEVAKADWRSPWQVGHRGGALQHYVFDRRGAG